MATPTAKTQLKASETSIIYTPPALSQSSLLLSHSADWGAIVVFQESLERFLSELLLQSVRFGVHYFVVAIKVICHICRRLLGAIKAQSEHFSDPTLNHHPHSTSSHLRINLNNEKVIKVFGARTLFISFSISKGRRLCEGLSHLIRTFRPQLRHPIAMNFVVTLYIQRRP